MRKQIDEAVMKTVAGGVDYTPDSLGATTGVCGKKGGSQNYKYRDEQEMLDYISAHWKDKEWTSIDERETYLINGLLEATIISPL